MKYKLELWSIDRNESALSAEAMSLYQKNCSIIFILFFFRNNNFNEDAISAYFQGLKKIMRSMKSKFGDFETKISKMLIFFNFN